MATCPRCFGALTENHKCPRGIVSRISDALFTAGIGGIGGWMFCLAIEERPAGALILAAAALGAVLATAVRQAISGPNR
jgi:hypothetical protein